MATILPFPTRETASPTPSTPSTCPECGGRTIGSERLGSGVCNECLDRRVQEAREEATPSTPKTRVRRPAQTRQGVRNALRRAGFDETRVVGRGGDIFSHTGFHLFRSGGTLYVTLGVSYRDAAALENRSLVEHVEEAVQDYAAALTEAGYTVSLVPCGLRVYGC